MSTMTEREMDNELIERIDAVFADRYLEINVGMGMASVPSVDYKSLWPLLWDCKIALTQQQDAEPVAWFTEDHTEDKSATTYDPEVAERWRAKGWPVTALYLHPPKPAAQPVDIDELSNFIRKIDGNNSMGAGALAENIVEWLEKQAARPQVPEGYQLVPLAATMKIESAIAASRNLKASDIWEDALAAAKEES